MRLRQSSTRYVSLSTSKNQNPREGIEIYCSFPKLDCFHRLPLQKTKIPARGLKSTGQTTQSLLALVFLQKTKIPARGLKFVSTNRATNPFPQSSSKNQNPREGIETSSASNYATALRDYQLQKTKIPARGLKQSGISSSSKEGGVVASKNQNPREGIETDCAAETAHQMSDSPSKNQNPREGIETRPVLHGAYHRYVRLQKTKIPARGLKPPYTVCARVLIEYVFKKPKSLHGIRCCKRQRYPH